jgi:hypothetical protein
VVPIVHHAGTAEVLYNLQALATFVQLKSKVIRKRPAARGVQVSALHPLGIYRVSKTDILISLLKRGGNLPPVL